MQLSPDAVQRIWGALCNQLQSRVPVCDRHLPTSLYRGQGPSWAFSYAGPSAWNTLPRYIRETVDSASFRKLLKTHYFTSAFDVVWFLQLLFYLRFHYRQDAAKRQTAGIKFTHRPKIRFFAPHGRLVTPIQVKLGRIDAHVGPLGCAKFHLNRPRGVGMRPQKYQKFPLLVKSRPAP